MTDSTQPHLRPLDTLPPGYSKFLGDIVARWSLIEHILTGCTYSLLRLSPKEGRIAVREPRAEDRLTMVQQLAEARGMVIAADWKTIKADLQGAQRSRDTLAHSSWHVLEGTDQVFLVQTAGNWSPPKRKGSVPRRITPEAVPWTLTDFREPMLALGSLLERLDDLQEKIDDALAP